MCGSTIVRYLLIACVGLLVSAGSHPAAAQSRLALVIGNAAYQHGGRLENPVNDARIIAKALTDVGFTVTTVVDADYRKLQDAFFDFGGKVRSSNADAVVYYAGHGVEVDGENFLMAVDARLQDARDAPREGIEVGRVMQSLRREEGRRGVTIMVLDACRNNPYISRTRSSSAGLAVPREAYGSLIAYATQPGSRAIDGAGKANGPYAEALAEAIRQPGLEVTDVFKRVGARIAALTKDAQRPWINGDFYQSFYFNAAARPEGGATGSTIRLLADYDISTRRAAAQAFIPEPADVLWDKHGDWQMMIPNQHRDWSMAPRQQVTVDGEGINGPRLATLTLSSDGRPGFRFELKPGMTASSDFMIPIWLNGEKSKSHLSSKHVICDKESVCFLGFAVSEDLVSKVLGARTMMLQTEKGSPRLKIVVSLRGMRDAHKALRSLKESWPFLESGQKYFKEKNWAAAVADLKKSIELGNKYAEVRLGHWATDVADGDRDQLMKHIAPGTEARKYFCEAMKRTSFDPGSIYNVAWCHEAGVLTGEAGSGIEAMWLKAARLGNPTAMLALARKAAQANDFGKARGLLEAAIKHAGSTLTGGRPVGEIARERLADLDKQEVSELEGQAWSKTRAADDLAHWQEYKLLFATTASAHRIRLADEAIRKQTEKKALVDRAKAAWPYLRTTRNKDLIAAFAIEHAGTPEADEANALLKELSR